MKEIPTPSEALAGTVVDRLVQSGLLRSDRRDQLVAAMAAGTIKSADWKVEVELAFAKNGPR